MAGGLTFADVKSSMAEVIENGVDSSDSRVLLRTNEATKILLDEGIWVGGMATYDVVATGTTLLLPKELENAIEIEPQGMATVNSQSDVTQGFYTLINNFTYVDPTIQHDNPLVDQFLQPDPDTPSILRRQYDYPGLTSGATVRVTGAKRYIPLTADGDYLIIQNVDALKSMVIALERKYNCNDVDGATKYKSEAIAILQAEVKKHLLDPTNSLKRKANYEADFTTYATGTFGWTRARIALEIPQAMMQGKSQLTRILEMAEMRLLDKGTWKSTIKDYYAQVVGGYIFFPTEVETVLAVDLCGHPIPIRSEFYEYAENGPGLSCTCSSVLIDQGEVRFSNGDLRRKYKLNASTTDSQTITVVAKLRWARKNPTDYMVIRNFEALRLMCMAIVDERNERWNEATANQASAVNVLQEELNGYLRGIKHVPVIDSSGMQTIGEML